MSQENVRQYYPNITCIETGGNVQYVINNTQEENSAQQILLSPEQHIVLNTTENQQIIIDQSQLQYASQGQQFIVQQENEDYQATEVINNQQQIYYASSTQTKHVIHSPQTPILAQQIISNTHRVVQHVSQSHPAVKQIVHQPPINNSLMVQRRIAVPQQIVQPRVPLVQPRVPQQVRLQYALQQPHQEQTQQQILQNHDDNQIILNEGRYMTLGQYRQEIAQQENQQVVVTQSVQPKPPPTKRNNKRNNKGGGVSGVAPSPRGRGRVVQQQQQVVQQQVVQQQVVQQQANSVVPKTQPFQQVQQVRQSPQQVRQSPQQVRQSPQQVQQISQQIHQSPQQVQQSPQQHQTPPQQHTPQPPPPKAMHTPQPAPKALMQYAGSPKPRMVVNPLQQQAATPRPMLQQQIRQQMQHHQQQFNNRNQPLIPLSPHVHNGHVQQQQQQSPAYSPQSNLSQVAYLEDSNSSMSDEYRDSARMLVCLENGEQRLITFTLPKESCTVQDLLEQVGVPFNSDTKIECTSNPGSEIDYIVNVGAVNGASLQVDAQQVLTVDNLGDPQECIVSQSGAVIPVSGAAIPAEPAPPLPSEPIAQPPPPPPPESPTEPDKPPETPKILPKFVSGCLAVCNHCGYLSEDFNRCQRCKTRLPEDAKSISLKADIKEEKKNANAKSVSPKPPKVTSPPGTKPPPKTPGRKKKPPQEVEPVVLTLSSDDEEDHAPKPNILARLIDSPITLSALHKEPIISENSDILIDSECINGGGAGPEDNKMISANSVTSLPCRTVRIGSYRFVPRDDVSITSAGVTIFVPIIGDIIETYKLFIPTKYIIKVLGNFNKTLPVLFFYVTPSIGVIIRKHIKMEEGGEYYFDPLSKEEPFKRITLLPEIVSDATRDTIKNIYTSTPYKMLEELSPKEANDILIRTCPREGLSQKQVQPQPVSFTEMRQLLIYPPGKGGIAINAEDYLCLAQDQFLNDVIIDFYLKYLATDVLAPLMQEKVYMFSSFFYKRLTTKPAKASKRSNPYEVDPNLTPAEKRHCRVKSWTKNVNIFEKDYVIIPINESSHWFLAIICFPGLEGCRSMYDTSKVVKVTSKEKKKIKTITIGNTTITTVKDDKNKVIEKPIKCDEEEGSDRDEAEGDDSELEDSENDSEPIEEPEKPVEIKKGKDREPIKQPCILIFDSLAGASRSRVVATLRDYLTCEHRTKLNSNKTFNKDNIKGACPKVPQQTNFTDCGLYVLQYVESFFKDPIPDYHIPLKMLKEWFEEIVVTRKREDISNLIKDLMSENNKDPSILPDIQFPTLNGIFLNNRSEDYEETEMEEEEEEEEETQEKPDLNNSLTQISTMYNSDSSGESPNKSENSSLTSTSMFVVSSVGSEPIKPDQSEMKNKSNRDTMSYLKSKRIIRHRNPETEKDSKKQKTDH